MPQTQLLSSLLLGSTLLLLTRAAAAHRLLPGESGEASSGLQMLIDDSMGWLSGAINLLKKVLVLTAMLFLIENLINFWVLASSYAFLAVQLPEYFTTTISSIYSIYNESLLQYIGITIHYPQLTVRNEQYDQFPHPELYTFNLVQFTLEPSILLALTFLELSLLRWILKKIKAKALQQRQEYLKQAIHAQAIKQNTPPQNKHLWIHEEQINAGEETFISKRSEHENKEQEASWLKKLMRNNQVDNSMKEDSSMKGGKSMKGGRRKGRAGGISPMELAYRMLEQRVRKELCKQHYKHWSEDISINKMEKVAALLINYMTGLLLPSFSLIFRHRLSNFSEKITMLVYYLLLGLVILFPFFYISRNKRNTKKAILKASEIETLSQYFLNMCMSVTLGIRTTQVPFLATTFVVLSFLLVYSLAEGSSSLTCRSMTLKKFSNVLHKLTFWLYNFTFLAMYLMVTAKDNSKDEALSNRLDGYAYYCSLACVGLFMLGGCHELVEFGLKALSTVFKLIYMIYEASSQQNYEAQDKDTISDVVVDRQLKNSQELQGQQASYSEENNVFENMRDIEEGEYSQMVQQIERQIVVHEVLLQHLQVQEYL